MKLLDTLLQLSNSARCISLFCCWYNVELQIITEPNKKPVCYHQNIGIDQNTTYVQVCKCYSDFYSNRTASWQFDIMQWGMFPVDVLYAFVLKCTKGEKPCLQESPSSVVITNKYLVCEQLKLSYPLKALIYWCWSGAKLASSCVSLSLTPPPSQSWPRSLLSTTQSFLSSPLPLPCARWPLRQAREGAGGDRGTSAGKPPVKKRCCTTSFAGKSRSDVSAHLLPTNPRWFLHLMHHSPFNTFETWKTSLKCACLDFYKSKQLNFLHLVL